LLFKSQFLLKLDKTTESLIVLDEIIKDYTTTNFSPLQIKVIQASVLKSKIYEKEGKSDEATSALNHVLNSFKNSADPTIKSMLNQIKATSLQTQ